MKSKLLPALLIILIVLNGVLIFMLIKKPHQNRKPPQERNFLMEELQFTENQNQKFKNLDEIHKRKMMDLDQKIRGQKDVLFSSFSKKMNIDSMALVVGNLEAKKEFEVFRFFKSVRSICTIEQQRKFDDIIQNAIRVNEMGPPREGQLPPPPPR